MASGDVRQVRAASSVILRVRFDGGRDRRGATWTGTAASGLRPAPLGARRWSARGHAGPAVPARSGVAGSALARGRRRRGCASARGGRASGAGSRLGAGVDGRLGARRSQLGALRSASGEPATACGVGVGPGAREPSGVARRARWRTGCAGAGGVDHGATATTRAGRSVAGDGRRTRGHRPVARRRTGAARARRRPDGAAGARAALADRRSGRCRGCCPGCCRRPNEPPPPPPPRGRGRVPPGPVVGPRTDASASRAARSGLSSEALVPRTPTDGARRLRGTGPGARSVRSSDVAIAIWPIARLRPVPEVRDSGLTTARPCSNGTATGPTEDVDALASALTRRLM